MLVDEGIDLLGLSSSNPYYIYPQWGRPFDAAPVGVPNPPDGGVQALTALTKWPFGRAKILWTAFCWSSRAR